MPPKFAEGEIITLSLIQRVNDGWLALFCNQVSLFCHQVSYFATNPLPKLQSKDWWQNKETWGQNKASHDGLGKGTLFGKTSESLGKIPPAIQYKNCGFNLLLRY
jgi:hypothetical protein